MDCINRHDWFYMKPDVSFVTEHDVDNSVSERILRNKFYDPLISSDSEDDQKFSIKWDEIFSKKRIEKTRNNVVQGIHPCPPFPKQSALTSQQHYQCLKVLCSKHPGVMPGDNFPRPTKQDYRHFESLKEIYEKEQKEFQEWAKTLWTSDHCVRALRPKPPIEMVYEAEFKVRANIVQSFPKHYGLAAQIPLETPNAVCEMVHQKEIIKVNVTTLPQLLSPDMTKRISIMKPCPVPEPCNKHPSNFILPNDNTMTVLPLTETHQELAQFALDNGAMNIASENALRCLIQPQRHWNLPLSVCQLYTPEGETRNVVVLGSEFSMRREQAVFRTYKAFRRLLQYALVPLLEVKSANERRTQESGTNVAKNPKKDQEMDVSDEEDTLFIDTGEIIENDSDIKMPSNGKSKNAGVSNDNTITENEADSIGNNFDFYSCTCKDTMFERPAQRSYRRWRVKNTTSNEQYELIVHTPHRIRGQSGEVLLEPIPEYQIDLGGSEQSPDKARGMALSLLLRKNASILNARIDSTTGDIVTVDTLTGEHLAATSPGCKSDIANGLLAALRQLQGLLPGHYILQHQPSHGNNAMLYSSKSSGGERLTLSCDGALLVDGGEATGVSTAPTLTPVLLPVHKFRRTLPCAFTPYSNQVARAPRPTHRQRTPPQAIKWPKKKGRKKKKTNVTE